MASPIDTISVFFLEKHYFYSAPKTNYLCSGESTSWHQISCGAFMDKGQALIILEARNMCRQHNISVIIIVTCLMYETITLDR
jgi:hypothetical protein